MRDRRIGLLVVALAVLLCAGLALVASGPVRCVTLPAGVMCTAVPGGGPTSAR